MSDLSEKVGAALYTALNVSGVTSLATGGVWHEMPSDQANLPVVVFQRQAPGNVEYTFGGPNRIAEDDLWVIKAISDEDSNSSYSPQGLNEAILAACETAHGSSLSLSGGSTTWAVYRISDIPTLKSQQTDRAIVQSGYLLRVVAAP